MHKNIFILKSFTLFFRHRPLKLLSLFLITLVLGFNNGVSIVLLIPMLSLLNPEATSQLSGSSGKLTNYLSTFLHQFGFQISLELILIVFAFSLLSVGVLEYYKSTIQAAYQQEFSYETRKRLYKKIITSDWTFLNGKSKHNHIQILTTEIPKMTMYYNYYMGLASKCIFIVTYVILALFISLKFTLFVILIGLTIFIVLRKYLKNAATLGNANIQSFRKMLKHIDDFWLTVKMAKVHSSEEFYFNKFSESNEQMLHFQYKQIKNKAIPQFLFSTGGVISLIFVVYAAHNIVHLPLTSLFVLILLFGRIFPQFIGINSDLNALVSNVSSVKLVLALDKEIKEREFENSKKQDPIVFKDSINIKYLTFGYDINSPLFLNFSESIPANKITGIVGKSGRGKTTLIDIIAGLQKVSDTTLKIDGISLDEENFPVWRKQLGYLPQDSFFIDGTIRENLIWDTEQIPDDNQLFEVLQQVNGLHLVTEQKQGLDTVIVNYQFHFSGGERQRLALARVLLRKPKLLLLDEATSALDPENELQIMDCLVNLKSELTIIFVTHRESLKPFFDKIIDLA
ncbi:MAG: ABC-type multidrug transport system fused ATPase/permease subunit [Flavobacterium sp.]|jgi:ABC-type multidrug transport system fused ATPase/permease subunit